MKEDLARTRLQRALSASRKAMLPSIDQFTSLVSEYAGQGWGGRRRKLTSLTTYVPLLAQAAEMALLQLLGGRPKISASAASEQQRAIATSFEVNLNALFERIKFHESLRDAALDAFFGFGVMKVGLADTGLVTADDEQVPIGMPCTLRISPCNFIGDMSAARPWSWQYTADIYRGSRKAIEDDDSYDQDSVRSSFGQINSSDARSLTLTMEAEYEEGVDLIDVWTAKDNMFCTYACRLDEQGVSFIGDPLRKTEWKGERDGPHHYLAYRMAPDNWLPLPPGADILPIHTIVNNSLYKQNQAAAKAKSVYIADDEELATQIRKLGNNQVGIVGKTGSQLSRYSTAMPDPALQSWLERMLQLGNLVAGNPNASGGYSISAPTLGQEQIIQGALSTRLAKQRERMLEFVAGVSRHLAWWMYHDDVNEWSTPTELPGVTGAVPLRWPPRDNLDGTDRRIPFEELRIELSPLLVVYRTPEERFQSLIQVLNGVVLPLYQAGAIQQAGGRLDPQGILDQAAEFLDQPEIRRLVDWQTPSMSQLDVKPTEISGSAKVDIPVMRQAPQPKMPELPWSSAQNRDNTMVPMGEAM